MVVALIFGAGIRALKNTATEIFSGKVSIALEMTSPPKLWPTSTTFLSSGNKCGISKACFELIPEAPKSRVVTLCPEDSIIATILSCTRTRLHDMPYELAQSAF
ncbi:hypothetical protein H5410_027931 [Solanum commersonii]|uniref:Uncharacterized protein n=1 Tax=Solanum commersonii TaxID=4109 RepID=A0A9J5Z3I4_SOLCO|nr:hypothetical protein H5410_027931 [Solanum commersonii]